MSKAELLEILAIMQSELDAREIVIATLKAERSKQLYFQAKYGRLSGTGGDPFLALQRDNDNQEEACGESALRPVYDNQLAQLENLIASQRKAQNKMREQLASMEKKYHKTCSELEEERRKHERDAAQGDDVLVMLEKERERLKSEVEYEKSQNRKLEKEAKKSTTSLEEERSQALNYKQVALMLIKQRRQLTDQVTSERRKLALVEEAMIVEKNKMRQVAEGLLDEWRRSQRQHDKRLSSSAGASVVLASGVVEPPTLTTTESGDSVSPGSHTVIRGHSPHMTSEEATKDELEAEVDRLRNPSTRPAPPSNTTPHRQKPEPPVRRTPESTNNTTSTSPSASSSIHHPHQQHHHHHHHQHHPTVQPPPVSSRGNNTPTATSSVNVKLTVGPSPTLNRKIRQTPSGTGALHKQSSTQSSSAISSSRITPPSKLGGSSSGPSDHTSAVKGVLSHVCVNGK